jgi:hypothetical protein
MRASGVVKPCSRKNRVSSATTLRRMSVLEFRSARRYPLATIAGSSASGRRPRCDDRRDLGSKTKAP